MKNKTTILFLVIALLLMPSLTNAQYYFDRSWFGTPATTSTGPPEIIFPVEGGASFTDDFGDARSDHLHEGNDLLAPKLTPIIAARAGRVVFAPFTEPSYGYMLSIAGDDGYTYNYLHINNDTPETDDGIGGPQYAYAPGITAGVQVTQGQHIAWVGDSGNAEATTPHLHFEIRLPDDTAIDPYPYLIAALQINSYDRVAVQAASPTINSDKGLIVTPETIVHCVDGSLIRTATISSVYYCGSDGKRYVFPSAQIYFTWYTDFSSVQTVSTEVMASIPIGGNVTYRPGIKLVKIQSDPRVYAVERNGTLRYMTNPTVATNYYGSSWANNVDDLSVAFLNSYTIGNPITN